MQQMAVEESKWDRAKGKWILQFLSFGSIWFCFLRQAHIDAPVGERRRGSSKGEDREGSIWSVRELMSRCSSAHEMKWS